MKAFALSLALASAMQPVWAQSSGAARAPATRGRAVEPGPNSDAVDVARAFFRALSAGRWIDAARMLDLPPIEQQRAHALQSARHPSHERSTTVDDLRRNNPDMPVAVAEWQIRQMEREQRNPWDLLAYDFAGIHDTAGLAQASSLELGARWLEARDERYLLRLAHERADNCAGVDVPELPSYPYEVIGAVTRRDTAYVLYWSGDPTFEADMAPGRTPQVVMLTRHDRRWIIYPSLTLLREFSGGMAVSCVLADSVARDTLRHR